MNLQLKESQNIEFKQSYKDKCFTKLSEGFK